MLSTLSLVANYSTEPRKDSLHGREFFVVRAVILREGVLSGNNGKLYYPRNEISRDAAQWNYSPLVYNHPTDPETGQHISARSAKELDANQLGIVLNAREEGGELSVDAWFDVEQTKRLDTKHGTDILGRLTKGQPIEVSTGLFTDNEFVSGSFDGKPFEGVARNYKADHLAVLPEDKGACSNKDGCGININSCGCEVCAAKHNHTKDSAMKFAQLQPKLIQEIVANSKKASEKSLKDLTPAQLKLIHSLTLNMDQDDPMYNMEEEEEEEKKPVAMNEATDEELAEEMNRRAMRNEGDEEEEGKPVAMNEATDEELEKELNRRKSSNMDHEEKEKKPVANKVTANQLPREMQQILKYGQEAMQRERAELIQKLTANVSAADANKHAKRLAGRSIEDLREDVALLPPAAEESYDYQSYFGPGPTANRGATVDKPEPLGQPVWDFSTTE